MKTSALAAALAGLCLLSCKQEKVDPNSGDQSLPASEAGEPVPLPSAPATNPEDFKVGEEEPGNPDAATPTPGQRLDHAIQKTEEGLETAKEKTEDGLRKAAGKTGEFLQKAGETIEDKAHGQ